MNQHKPRCGDAADNDDDDDEDEQMEQDAVRMILYLGWCSLCHARRLRGLVGSGRDLWEEAAFSLSGLISRCCAAASNQRPADDLQGGVANLWLYVSEAGETRESLFILLRTRKYFLLWVTVYKYSVVIPLILLVPQTGHY